MKPFTNYHLETSGFGRAFMFCLISIMDDVIADILMEKTVVLSQTQSFSDFLTNWYASSHMENTGLSVCLCVCVCVCVCVCMSVITNEHSKKIEDFVKFIYLHFFLPPLFLPWYFFTPTFFLPPLFFTPTFFYPHFFFSCFYFWF